MTDQQYAPPPPGYHHAPPPQSKGLGIAAMVIGIVAIVLSFIPVIGLLSFILGPVAVVLGIVAFVKRNGRGQAIAGIITGALGTVIVFIGFLLFDALMSDLDEAMQKTESDTDQSNVEDRQEEVEEQAEDAASAAGEEDADVEDLETSATPEEEGTADGGNGEWVEVTSLSGTADQRGEVITLSGDSRLVYNFEAADEDFGVATVYVVPAGDVLSEDGGLPELMLSGSESGETMLYESGEYYLDVSAANYSSWSVTVEERE